MAIKEGLQAFNWITGRIDQVCRWVKGKRRRNDVQTMDSAIGSGDAATVNAKLDRLRKDSKNKADARS